jgi:thiopeptide-type bacteriocin biosynthesis protein
LTEAVRETLKREEQNQAHAIFAEIVHANEARIGNISTRPVLRSFEIPILAHGGVDHEHTIPLSDLTLSLADDRLVLRSKRLNREVIPRLSSAHNYSDDTISAYRFLCDLQYEGVQSSIGWSWGVLKQAPYLPMVRIGNIILSPAKWRLTAQETASVKNATALASVVADLRQKHEIPRYVLVGESDNKIPVDLENEEHLSVFQKLIEASEVIEESQGNGDFLFCDATGAGYSNELIIPLENADAQRESNRLSRITSAGVNLRRNFTLGSEWLYYKIYCNTNASDQILRDLIKPLSSGLLQDEIIDRWFFIRYHDPDSHIRLRFQGKGFFYHEVIARFHRGASELLDSGLIASINTDVYRRELERYGHENIEACEALFCIDSQCIISLIELAEGDDELSWQLALALTDQWFSNFDILPAQRKDIMLDLQQKFFEELHVEHLTKKSIATKLRHNRQSIEAILCGKQLPGAIGEALTVRENAMRPIAKNILKMSAEGRLSISLGSLLKNYIHMSINRLLSANQRHQEMVLYDFLYQFYHSQSKRKASA